MHIKVQFSSSVPFPLLFILGAFPHLEPHWKSSLPTSPSNSSPTLEMHQYRSSSPHCSVPSQPFLWELCWVWVWWSSGQSYGDVLHSHGSRHCVMVAVSQEVWVCIPLLKGISILTPFPVDPWCQAIGSTLYQTPVGTSGRAP